MTARIGAISGSVIRKKIWAWRGPVDLGRLVQLAWDGVEEALHQPGVDAQRPAEVRSMQAPHGVEPDAGRVADLGEDQVEGDERQELREHLDQQQREQARTAGR